MTDVETTIEKLREDCEFERGWRLRLMKELDEANAKLRELTDIGHRLVAWEDALGGWEAEVWRELRAALAKVPA